MKVKTNIRIGYFDSQNPVPCKFVYIHVPYKNDEQTERNRREEGAPDDHCLIRGSVVTRLQEKVFFHHNHERGFLILGRRSIVQTKTTTK